MKAQILGLGIQGKSPAVTAQRRLNLYYDVQPQADKSTIAAYPTPGTVLFCDTGASATRGMWYMESLDKLFIVARQFLYEISYAGAITLRGTLASGDDTGRVSMSDNGAGGNQLIIVTGSNGYIWNTNTNTFSTIASAFPGGDTVTFLDSFFIVNRPGTGQFWISDSYDGTVWNALNFATAEANPDNLVAVVADRGGLTLFGSISVELWYNTGALDFPFQRIQGAPAEAGLAARWSLARCNGMWTGVFRNRQSGYFIGRLNGYQIEPISTAELDYLINGYTTPGDSVAFAYTMSGHAFYQITFQSQSVTWLYDATSGVWSQLETNGLTRHVGDLGASFGSNVIVSHYNDGALCRLSPTVYTDNGSPIARELVGAHIYSAEHLNRLRVQRLRLDMEGGMGLSAGQGSNPTVMLQISRDGGHTWGNELWANWGKIGEYTHRAEWRRLGQGRDYVFKVRVTDSVKTVFINAFIEGEESQA